MNEFPINKLCKVSLDDTALLNITVFFLCCEQKQSPKQEGKKTNKKEKDIKMVQWCARAG